jgi:hypothetical protein
MFTMRLSQTWLRYHSSAMGMVGICPEYPCAHATGTHNNMQQVIFELAPFARQTVGLVGETARLSHEPLLRCTALLSKSENTAILAPALLIARMRAAHSRASSRR